MSVLDAPHRVLVKEKIADSGVDLLREHHLQARERRHDVEGAEVAAVRDPQDLALQVVLPAVGRDPELA